MQSVVIVIHLFVVLAMIGVVLLQKSEGGGLGMGGGGAGGFLSSRGSANVLTRATAILAFTFFLTSLILSILAGVERRPTSILQSGAPAQAPAKSPNPSAPGGSLLDRFQKTPAAPSGGQPPAPSAPAAPQAPQSR
ncbi:MAG TPA: preprotein translocase subunit SecG [Xanthobacteraceae bacterium]|nr:preprotein translocase subunit SecG [Xanthobacteraceae bacterium]